MIDARKIPLPSVPYEWTGFSSMQRPRELSPEAVEHFIDRGFCTLESAFTAAQAVAVRDLVWARMRVKAGIDRDNPATWPEAYDIEEHLDEPAMQATST